MKTELLSLTGLRFVAALAIIFHHLQGVLWLPTGSLGNYSLNSGVSFFFVLSGFVLYYSYHASMDRFTWAEFAFLRFFRVWPAHVAALFIACIWLNTAAFDWLLPRLSGLDIASILFLFQAWSTDFQVFWGLNGPSWSISTELFFYVVFPALLIILRHTPSGFLLCLTSLTLLWLTFASAALFDPDQEFGALALAYINPLARVGEFGAGMLTAQIYLRRPPVQKPQASLGWTLRELAVLGGIILQNAQMANFGLLLTGYIGPVALQWITSSSGFLLFAVAIWVFAQGRGWVAWLLAQRVFVRLGTISFATYLIHQPVIFYLQNLFKGSDSHIALQIALFVALVLCLSAAIHAFVERPAMQFAKTLVSRRRARSTRT